MHCTMHACSSSRFSCCSPYSPSTAKLRPSATASACATSRRAWRYRRAETVISAVGPSDRRASWGADANKSGKRTTTNGRNWNVREGEYRKRDSITTSGRWGCGRTIRMSPSTWGCCCRRSICDRLGAVSIGSVFCISLFVLSCIICIESTIFTSRVSDRAKAGRCVQTRVLPRVPPMICYTCHLSGFVSGC